MATYFYKRISRKEANDRHSYVRQRKSLMVYAKTHDLTYSECYVYRDDASGLTFDRKEWLELEGKLNSGDTIVFKEISRFTLQAEEGYNKYMELMNKGINLVFIDNPTVSTDYIKQLMNVAEEQDLVAKTALENTIKLLLIVELDRVQKEREIMVKRIKEGLDASGKKSGRKPNTMDKMTDELREDIIKFINDRSIKQVDLMEKHNISRNTLKRYIQLVKPKEPITNQRRIEKYAKKLGLILDLYYTQIDKLSENQLIEVLQQIEYGDGDVKVVIDEKHYIVRVSIYGKSIYGKTVDLFLCNEYGRPLV